MKLTIDENICLKHKMSFEEFLMALMYRQVKDPEEVLQNLANREICVVKDGKLLITQHWSEVIDEILCDSQGSDKSDEELLALVKKMRECFPEGKMPGTPYYYRCNNSEVIKKMKKFFIQYGSYPDDEIIDACKRFVASFQGNYKYLPLIKYFIFKVKNEQGEDGSVHKVEHSPLADYLENKEEGEGVVNTSDDWMISIKN